MKKNIIAMLALVAAMSAGAETKDVTSLIKNADFTQELEGWVLEKAEPQLEFTTDENGTVAVSSKGAFTLSQDVAGLENGLYMLQVNGYFSLSFGLWPYLFCPEVTANAISVPLMHCLEDQLPLEDAVDKKNCYITPSQKNTDYFFNFSYYVPSSDLGAAYAFNGDRYTNSIIADVTDGTMHIEIQNPQCTDYFDWTAFGKMRLYRLGDVEEIGKELDAVLNELLLKGKDLAYRSKTQPGENAYTSFSNKVRDELKNLIPEMEKAGTNTEKLEAVRALSTMLHKVMENQLAYRSQYKEAERYLGEIKKVLSDEECFEQLDYFISLYNHLYNAYISGTLDVENNTQMRKIKSSWAYKHVFDTDGIQSVEGQPAYSALFDLSGRKLEQKPTKGIYIQNGQKVLVK